MSNPIGYMASAPFMGRLQQLWHNKSHSGYTVVNFMVECKTVTYDFKLGGMVEGVRKFMMGCFNQRSIESLEKARPGDIIGGDYGVRNVSEGEGADKKWSLVIRANNVWVLGGDDLQPADNAPPPFQTTQPRAPQDQQPSGDDLNDFFE